MAPTFEIANNAFFRRTQKLTLWLLALLHIFILTSFLLVIASLSPAHAQATAPACSGRNLLNDLKTSDPATYDKVIAEGKAVPNSSHIFWKLEKPGMETSYLMGTMHVSDPRVLNMPAFAREAKASAKTIVVESDEVLDEKKTMATMLMKPELTMFTDGRSLDTLLSKEDVQTLKDGLKERGVVYSAVSRMKPWMLMSIVGTPACELARKGADNTFLDKQIALDAIAAGKTVKGLESLEEQANAINAIPLDLHLKSLVEAVRMGKKMDDVFFTMTELYLSQQIGVLMPLLKTIAPDGTENHEGYAEFDRLVVTKRNHLMADRAAKIVNEGSTFIAVGAAHLPGEEGLVELFRQQGFKVTPLS